MDLSKLKTLDDVQLAGKAVLVRVDINVPLKDGVIGDDTRIRAIVPTVKDILDAGGKPILMAHLGRPKGKVVADLSTRALCAALEAAIGARVDFAQDHGPGAAERAQNLQTGDVLLLENVRFDPGEEANSDAFCKTLAALGDVYVNDAFSAAHRAHASTAGVAQLLPAVAGRQMQAELAALRDALEAPQRPVAAVVGGAKVSTKIDVLSNLVTKVDKLIVGGGMANTFLLAQGRSIGTSLCEPDLVDQADTIKARAEASGCKILLPIDVTVAKDFKEGADSRTAGVGDVAADEMILDVGPETVAGLKSELADCRTLVWNGPLGAFEISPFGTGTFALAREAAALTTSGHLLSVAGGGDTVSALNMAGVADQFACVSTAGGAFLEWLEGRELPGVSVLIRQG